MDEELDIEELHQLVDAALETEPRQPATAVPKEVQGLLTYGDVRSLELLVERVLPGHLDRADAQMVVDELRSSLMSDVRSPDLASLHGTIARCRRCPNVVSSPHLPLGNRVDPDLVCVVETVPPLGLDLLTEELKTAGFSSTRVALTSVTRCRSGAGGVQDAEVKNCTPYLHHELTTWRPKLILTMGALPASVLFQTDLKLGEERGAVHWLGPWAVLPTYSVGYVQRSEGRLSDLRQDLKQAYEFCYGNS